jgi:quinoprotein dehydrogenase-associated probable ABC transporter substrate-binding protein
VNAGLSKRHRLLAAGAAIPALCLALAGPAAAIEPEHRDAVRVCADGNMLPYSNEKLEGFENRLAEMIGRELGVPVIYTWWPATIGFVRNTLNAHKCDVIMGTAEGGGLVQHTNPYYRSVYVLVYRQGGNFAPKDMSDPALKQARIGIVAQTPGATLVNRLGLTNVEPYPLNTDTRVDNPARRAIEDVASGHTDATVIWGPIAGYYAARQTVPLAVVPLSDGGQPKLDFGITMGVRQDEPNWKHWLNGFIDRHQDEIDRMLAEYHVPRVDENGKVLAQGGAESGAASAR